MSVGIVETSFVVTKSCIGSDFPFRSRGGRLEWSFSRFVGLSLELSDIDHESRTPLRYRTPSYYMSIWSRRPVLFLFGTYDVGLYDSTDTL